ncbi:MAG: TAT-variant-translocated molybdopterin oxidoreductase [Blastocatellia bacterium]|nr:TAT-variant-translocated molybdopterin oxidoreductase [Blastocatellia bacterium]
MSEDRHINFKLMRQYILDYQDGSAPKPAAGGLYSIQPLATGAEKSKKYWRSLEELADEPEFRELVAREFPQAAEEWNDPFERRTFLKLMGASLALAGLSGCAFQPPEKIVPYVKQPEEEVPGKALFFATASSLGGIATPLLARSNEGRPTKVEGNPDHPNSRTSDPHDRGSSATDIFSQASILSLYDPDRAQTPLYRDEARTWSTFVGEIRTALDEQRPKQGAGIRFLTETVTSPSLAAQLKGILTEFSQAKWHQYEPANNDNARAGAVMAFGQPVNTICDFSKADRILSLDADFLAAMPGTLRYARDFAARRRVSEGQKEINRLYVIETTPTTTGAKADHRWSVKPSHLENYARAFAGVVGGQGNSPSGNQTVTVETRLEAGTGEDHSKSLYWPDLQTIARDLQQHRGASIVIAGNEAPPAVHALVHAMNDALGNVGKTVFYTESLEANPVDQRQSLQELINDIDASRVDLLVVVGGNPVYNTPADLKLNQDRMFKTKLRVHLSQYRDETSELCHWNIPETHYLEAWSDTRAYDGTVTIVQPLIEPLYQNKSAHELLAVFTAKYDQKPYDIIREYWQGEGQKAVGSRQKAESGTPTGQGSEQMPRSASAASRTPSPSATPAANATSASTPAVAGPSPSADFESWWRRCVHDGFIPNTSLPTKTVSVNAGNIAQADAAGTPAIPAANTNTQFELVFRTDPTIYDGRFANNGWLQELPKPLTKLTWDNAALVSPNTAKQLGLEKTNGKKGREAYVDTVKISYQGRTISNAVPAYIMPGQPDGVITLHLGYGRKRAGRVGNDHGFNAYEIRTAAAPWSGAGAQVEKGPATYLLALTQQHFNLEDPNFSKEPRDIFRQQTLEQYLRGEHNEHESEEPAKDDTLYDPKLYDYQNQGNGLNYAWGMAIDLNNCIGCNGCTIACQSENNIPVVGKEQVVRSREMHWIRLDTYFEGDDASNPEGTHFMPVPCMHCENAPCEPVCPVHATVHSAEGLNDMVYNRCVGTKYCSNNCPYKVRRFNFFLYQDWETPTYQLMRNPDVSVRSRGVMEKCTYCVQRIQSAKITSEIEGRKVRDGEIVTACQAVCPTEAIVFGDINDPNSKVSKLKAEQRNYSLLGELNTKPRTTYLSALRNPNPEIKS